MQRLGILWRLVRNRFSLARALGGGRRLPASEAIVFLLNLCPPYNLLCWLWVKTSARRPDAAFGARLSRYLLRHGLLFGALRHLAPEDRRAFADAVIAIPAVRRTDALSPPAAAAVEGLRQAGFARLGTLASADDVAGALSYFRQQSGYLAQTPLQSDGVLRPFDVERLIAERAARYFCFAPAASLACAPLARIVRHPLLSEIAGAYLRMPPRLYSINCFATIAGDADHYVMRLHRDYDDFRFVAFFVYWTAAGAEDGATLFVPGSHARSDADRGRMVALAGEAGTVFAIDGFGLHAGNRSVARFRLASWIRFGSIPNLATIQDGWLLPEPPGSGWPARLDNKEGHT